MIIEIIILFFIFLIFYNYSYGNTNKYIQTVHKKCNNIKKVQFAKPIIKSIHYY